MPKGRSTLGESPDTKVQRCDPRALAEVVGGTRFNLFGMIMLSSNPRELIGCSERLLCAARHVD
jgi:hypothetical protein